MRSVVLIGCLVALAGCATSEFDYQGPRGNPPTSQSLVLEKPFDETWDQLVDHVSKTFFSIDNFEKDSGLMIVNFSTQASRKYVECGTLNAKWTANYQPQSFSGDYARYLGTYMGATVNGRANITLLPEGADKTRVSIAARYVLSSPASPSRPGTTWSFSTTTMDAQQVSTPKGWQTRVCRATGKFEKDLLKTFQ